jgi:hypothetical protein
MHGQCERPAPAHAPERVRVVGETALCAGNGTCGGVQELGFPKHPLLVLDGRLVAVLQQLDGACSDESSEGGSVLSSTASCPQRDTREGGTTLVKGEGEKIEHKALVTFLQIFLRRILERSTRESWGWPAMWATGEQLPQALPSGPTAAAYQRTNTRETAIDA